MLTRARFIHLNSAKEKTCGLNIQPPNNEEREGRREKQSVLRCNPAPPKHTPTAGQGHLCSRNVLPRGWLTGPYTAQTFGDESLPDLFTAPGTLQGLKAQHQAGHHSSLPHGLQAPPAPSFLSG